MSNKTNDEKLRILQERLGQIKQKQEILGTLIQILNQELRSYFRLLLKTFLLLQF